MRQRIWIIRLISVLIFSAIALLISLFLKNSYIVNYINTSFIIGLIFLVISGISFVTIAGFFRVFAEGFKIIFRREDTSIDKTHWSYDKKTQNTNNKLNYRMDKVKKELFIFLPLIIGICLVIQSIIILNVN